MVRIGSLELNYKGGFINDQIERLKYQAGGSAQAAQAANVTATMKCNDPGAGLFQSQLQKQQQQFQDTLTKTLSGAKGAN